PSGLSRFSRYHFSLIFLLYLLPLLVIGCAYGAVGRTLWASAIPGDSSERYHEQVSAKRKVRKVGTAIPTQLYLPLPLAMSTSMCSPVHPTPVAQPRFRLGFKLAFRWCPCIRASAVEGLELHSARFLRARSSVSKISRMDTSTVASALGAADEEPDEPGGAERFSLDVASNGSSKTVSESFSFYSNTPT
ncbi:NK1R protein, partial [Spelaeornis formosus]|nr:NK1R protein [Elachura formosa]